MDIDKIIDKQVALVNQALQIGVEAGQQSRQAEVDELQKRIDEALNTYLKVGIVGLDSACIKELRDILKGKEND